MELNLIRGGCQWRNWSKTIAIFSGTCLLNFVSAQNTLSDEPVLDGKAILSSYSSFEEAVLEMSVTEWEVVRSWDGFDNNRYLQFLRDYHDSFEPVRDAHREMRLQMVSENDACGCWVEPDESYTTMVPPPSWWGGSLEPGEMAWANQGGAGWNVHCASSPIPLSPPANPWTFELYGDYYENFFINSNGTISFGGDVIDWTPTGFPAAEYNQIAGYWQDADIRSVGEIKWKRTNNAVYVNFIDVGFYDNHSNLTNSFQIIITHPASGVVPEGNNVQLCYLDMNWAHGDVGGSGGCCGDLPGVVGVDQGSTNPDNTASPHVQLGRFNLLDDTYNGPYGTGETEVDGINWLDNKFFNINTTTGYINANPLPAGNLGCDTIQLCLGQEFPLEVQFLGPEPMQTVTLSIEYDIGENEIEGVQVTNGNFATFDGTFVANALGTYAVTVTAEDSDGGATMLYYVVNVLTDLNGDGMCDPLEGYGCTIPEACNYDPEAAFEDYSCDFQECQGCTDPEAFNFDPTATIEGECLYCNADTDEDGVCDDVDDCVGEYDACEVCNGPGYIYECGCEPLAPGVCDCEGAEPDAIGICGGDCTTDFNSNGVCDDQETLGCTYPLATNFNEEATTDDGSCVFPCVGDVNQNIFDWDANGNIGIADFLQMLSVFGDVDVDGDGVWDSQDDCVDLEACNYDSDPTELCLYLDILGVCGGGCEADEDDDGICDDVDTCIGVVDECGVCNGPGATEIIVEDIIFTYDSIFLPVDNEWFVYASSVDTIFGFECPPPFGECDSYIENPSSLGMYSLTIEPHEAVNPEHGTVYRFYVNALDDTDMFSAVFGDSQDTLAFETPEGIFNSPLNTYWNASGLFPALFTAFPDLQDDSYGTIVLDGPAQDSDIPGAVEPNWIDDSSLSPSLYEYFTSGGTGLNANTTVGVAWFLIHGDPNSFPVDGRWLIAQITTTGSISGQIPVQIFPLGEQSNTIRQTFEFEGCGTFY